VLIGNLALKSKLLGIISTLAHTHLLSRKKSSSLFIIIIIFLVWWFAFKEIAYDFFLKTQAIEVMHGPKQKESAKHFKSFFLLVTLVLSKSN